MNKTISDITLSIIGGGTPARNIKDFWTGNIPWATVKDVKEGLRFLDDTEEHITEAGLKSSAANVVQPGSLLLCTRMAVGRSIITTKRTAINQDLKCLLFKPEFDISFIYYQLNRLREKLEGQSIGSTVKGISVIELKKLSFFCPTNHVQRKIAHILSTIDGQIEKTETIIAKYQAVKQGMLQDLFTRGIDVRTGQLRPCYEDAPELYQESALGMIPRRWEVVRLKDIGETESPYLKTGPFGSSLKISDWVDSGIPVITIGSLGDNSFIESELLMITKNKAEKLSGYRMDEGDIVFSRVADVGRSLVIKGIQKGWVMSSNFMRIRLNKEFYNPDFLQLIIKYSDGSRKQQSQFVNANGRTVVNSTTLNSFLFPKPSLPEQREILRRIQSLEAVYLNEKQTLVKLQLLKQGMMQDLLSGKVEVTA